MPQTTFFLMIGAVIAAAALTVAAMVWLGGGTLAPLTIIAVIVISGALKLYLRRS